MRRLRQPTVLQESNGNRITGWLFVLVVHAAMLGILMLGLAGNIALRESPAMALLFPSKSSSKLPEPVFLPVTIAKPVAEAPEVKVAEEEAAAPAPVDVTPSPILAFVNNSDSMIVASQAPGGDGSGLGDARKSGGGAASGGGLDLSEYLRRVSEHIQRFVPRGMPRSTPATGLARVYLRWTREGTVTSVRLSQSSGDDWIDNAALMAIKRAGRLPPIPPEFDLKEIEGSLPVYYKR
jgi:protein TonB